MAYRPHIDLAEEDVGGLLKLSLTYRSRAPGGGEEAGFLITFDDHIDGDYPYVAVHPERFRNIDDALMAFAHRQTNNRPWLLHQARTANETLDAGPSLSVPAASVKSLINEIEARIDIHGNPEIFYAAIFATELARRSMSEQEAAGIAAYPREYVISATSDRDPSHYVEMAIVDNPVAAEQIGRPQKVIRLRSVTSNPSRSGEGYEVETENGVEYFHDVHLATLAYEGRAAEAADMPSGFGMQLSDDGGRDELKDSLLGIRCASIPLHTARTMIEVARKQGIDRRMPEIVDDLEELVAVAYGVPDLVQERSLAS
jgi:hypothetical protein